MAIVEIDLNYLMRFGLKFILKLSLKLTFKQMIWLTLEPVCSDGKVYICRLEHQGK